ncbi:ParB/RepB/Spo0J family partition protein [Kribbella sp. NPDC051587]|uniref:ParB/RepB/Spo0J family partition protein n=1 Tax=Kribbella sp. NPDC051587 TaxID=3364119 RepID=UPI0037AD8070
MAAEVTAAGSTTRTKSSSKQAGGRKTKSRFGALAGNSDEDDLYDGEPDESPADGGILAGIASRQPKRVQTIDGHAVVDIRVDDVAPHPFNDPQRSVPQPGNAKWEELVNGVRANGVKIPGLFVTRTAFLARRPQLAEQIGDAEYVAIYGHRRLAAAREATRETMKAVVDDTTMENDGDLDAMALENLGREDLGDLAEARMYARYSEQAGLGQRAIAERLGVDQSVVSRRLALLLLCPEVQGAIELKQIPSAAAAALAGALPYGPARKWQKAPDPDQTSAARRADQIAALELITRTNITPPRAAERVLAERKSREEAAAAGLRLVDPTSTFGKQQAVHRLYSDEAVEAARREDRLVAAIAPEQGTLEYYSEAAPAGADDPEEDVLRQRKEATAARRSVCARLASAPPGKDALLEILVAQRLEGQDGQSAEVWRLAAQWAQAADLQVPTASDRLRTTASAESKPATRQHLAWLLALARYEISAAGSTEWGPTEIGYCNLLRTRGDYSPTAWEQKQLAQAALTE